MPKVYDPDRWVACSKAEYGHSGEESHLLGRGGLTTRCGITASAPEVWRTNSTKHKCLGCQASWNRRTEGF